MSNRIFPAIALLLLPGASLRGMDIAATLPTPNPAALADPLAWEAPAHRPTIEPLLKTEEYARQSRKILAGIHRDELAKAGIPCSGIHITVVEPHSAAEDQNIHVGDVIMQIDDDPATLLRFHVRADGKNPYHMTLWSPPAKDGEEGATRRITMQPGKVGVTMDPFLNLVRLYWTAGHRNAKWDDDMLVGLSVRETQPVVATTALAHAAAAGCDDPLLSAAYAFILFEQDRYNEALTFGLPVFDAAPAGVQSALAAPLAHAGMLSYHLRVTQKIVGDYPECFGPEDAAVAPSIDAAITYHYALAKALRLSCPPVEEPSLANAIDFSDRVRHLEYLKENVEDADYFLGGGIFDFGAKDWRNDHKIHIPAATDRFTSCDFGPGFPDAFFSVTFNGRPHDAKKESYMKSVGVGIFNYSPTDRTATEVVRAIYQPDGHVGVENPVCPMVSSAHAWKPGTSHTVKVVGIHQRIEVLMDDLPVFDGPLMISETDRHLVGFIFVCGMTANVTALEWKRIRPIGGPAGKGNDP